MPTTDRKTSVNSAKPSDILTWPLSLGPLGKEIKVFEVSFSERNLRKALNAIYEEDYKASSDGKAFLKKAVPVVQQDLKSVGHNFSEATIQEYFLKQLPDTAANRAVYRLKEKIVRRLLSIITEAQCAAERHHEIAAGLTQHKANALLDEIYGSNYQLTYDVLGIQKGRRRETRKQFIQKQCKQLKQLGSKRLTQSNLAAEQGTDSANLRKRMRLHGIRTHGALLKLCGFT